KPTQNANCRLIFATTTFYQILFLPLQTGISCNPDRAARPAGAATPPERSPYCDLVERTRK
ncbi:MAG: hypothetical protein ACK53Y_18195, partial [bacterium]